MRPCNVLLQNTLFGLLVTVKLSSHYRNIHSLSNFQFTPSKRAAVLVYLAQTTEVWGRMKNL